MPASKEIDPFDIESINAMVFLLENQVSEEDLITGINHLSQLKLEYTLLKEKNIMLEDKVLLDPKTGSFKYSNEYFQKVLHTAAHTLREYKGNYNLSYFRIDIDDFSNFNNTYGHDVGDKVLETLAQTIIANSRSTDYLLRFGGEEFDMILNTTDSKGAQLFIDNIYKHIRQIKIKHHNKDLKVTISGGLSSVIISQNDLIKLSLKEIDTINETLQIQADNALYEAKFKGKDTYCVYDKKKESKYPDIREAYQNSKLKKQVI